VWAWLCWRSPRRSPAFWVMLVLSSLFAFLIGMAQQLQVGASPVLQIPSTLSYEGLGHTGNSRDGMAHKTTAVDWGTHIRSKRAPKGASAAAPSTSVLVATSVCRTHLRWVACPKDSSGCSLKRTLDRDAPTHAWFSTYAG